MIALFAIIVNCVDITVDKIVEMSVNVSCPLTRDQVSSALQDCKEAKVAECCLSPILSFLESAKRAFDYRGVEIEIDLIKSTQSNAKLCKAGSKTSKGVLATDEERSQASHLVYMNTLYIYLRTLQVAKEEASVAASLCKIHVTHAGAHALKKVAGEMTKADGEAAKRVAACASKWEHTLDNLFEQSRWMLHTESACKTLVWGSMASLIVVSLSVAMSNRATKKA